MIHNILHTINQCKAGNRQAQKLLFQTYNQKLFAVSMKYMHNRHNAEEVLQDSWIEIFKSLDRYEHQNKLEGWMKTIVIRKAWRTIKKRKPTVELKITTQPNGYHTEKQLIDKMTCEEILTVVDTLPTGCREVFKMYVIDGFKHDEIADVLEISNSTSRAHLSRARKMIATKIDKMNKIYS